MSEDNEIETKEIYIELGFYIEAKNKEEAIKEFKEIYGSFVYESADDKEVYD